MAPTVVTLILLGLLHKLVGAQPPDLFLETGSIPFSCAGDAVTYRCEGTGSVLVWNVVSFSQILYQSSNNEPGDGGMAGPAVSSLIQETPTIVSTLSIVDTQYPRITIMCSVGSSISSVSSSQIEYRISAPVQGSPNVSLTNISAGSGDVGAVKVDCLAPAGDFVVGGCLIKLYVDGNLNNTLRTAGSTSDIIVSFNRPNQKFEINVTVEAFIFTSCNQTSEAGISSINYIFDMVDTQRGDCRGYEISLIIVCIILGISLILVTLGFLVMTCHHIGYVKRLRNASVKVDEDL